MVVCFILLFFFPEKWSSRIFPRTCSKIAASNFDGCNGVDCVRTGKNSNNLHFDKNRYLEIQIAGDQICLFFMIGLIFISLLLIFKEVFHSYQKSLVLILD